jgi:hypothetical protein
MGARTPPPPKIPTKVKIGYRDYRIESWHPHEASGARRYGETNNISQVIRIDFSNQPCQVAETLLHEIFHAVCAVWGLGEKDDEERIVSMFGSGLTTVWRDNPDVMAWIDEQLCGGKT